MRYSCYQDELEDWLIAERMKSGKLRSELKELSELIASEYLCAKGRAEQSCALIRVIQKYGIAYDDGKPRLDVTLLRIK